MASVPDTAPGGITLPGGIQLQQSAQVWRRVKCDGRRPKVYRRFILLIYVLCLLSRTSAASVLQQMWIALSRFDCNGEQNLEGKRGCSQASEGTAAYCGCSYVEPTQEIIAALSQKVESLQEELRASQEREEQLRTELRNAREAEHSQHVRVPATVQVPCPPYADPDPGGKSTHTLPQNLVRTSQESLGPLLGHVGRLVQDACGVGRFAGAPTGAHFVLSVQEQFQETFSSNMDFPEWMFRLHLLPPFDACRVGLRSSKCIQVPAVQNFWPAAGSDQIDGSFILANPRDHYYAQAEAYFQTWGRFYPILSVNQFYDSLNRILSLVQDGKPLCDADIPFLFQLYAVITLNVITNEKMRSSRARRGDMPSPNAGVQYQELLCHLSSMVSARGDLTCLQGLVLYLLCLQLISHHSLAVQTNGMVVKLAQSLGLHRHSRRFKHSPSESDLRRRIWWCVFILDVYTSMYHGLPRSIKSADVDVDLTMDVDFHDISIQHLPSPLTGEMTNSGWFLHHIQIAQILSRCLDQLYTTTQRRGGVEKIAQLESELQLWKRNLPPESLNVLDDHAPLYTVFKDDPLDASGLQPGQSFISAWLLLLGELTTLLIHRCALTFDRTEPQFMTSLRSSTVAATRILRILHRAREIPLIFWLWPLGLHVIAQSALLVLYACWLDIRPPSIGSELMAPPAPRTELTRISGLDPRTTALETLIRTTCDILALHSATELSRNRPEQEGLARDNYSAQTAEFLQYLLRRTLEMKGTYS